MLHEMTARRLRDLLQTLGLVGCPACLGDRAFYLALSFGLLIVCAMRSLLPMERVPALWQAPAILSLIVWQPIVEELLFRGILQGHLLEFPWGQRRWLGISGANLVSSLAFVAMHLVYHPAGWALSIFFPSLAFGYFRERHHSLYPPILLHGVFNLGYLLALTTAL